MMFQGKKIGWCFTGSYCTIQSAIEQMKLVKAEGADIYPFISFNVSKTDTRFGTAEEWIRKIEEITEKKVVKTIEEAEPYGPLKLFDVMVIAPCTGNTMAKLANAITDTPVLMVAKAHVRNKGPLVLSIATNDALGANAKNLGMLLNMKHIYFVPFKQDDPIKKCNSMVGVLEKVSETMLEAMKGQQIQPILH